MNDDNITMSRGIYDDSTCMQRDRRRVAGDGSCLRRREPGHLPPPTLTHVPGHLTQVNSALHPSGINRVPALLE